MQIKIFSGLQKHKTDLLVLGMFEKEKISKEISKLDKALNKEINHALKNKEFKGSLKETYSITTLGRLPAKKILLIGLGKKKDYDLDTLRNVSAASAVLARELNVKNFSTTLHSTEIKKTGAEQRAQGLVEGTILGLYEFKKYQTVDKDKRKEIKTITLVAKKDSAISKGIELGKLLAEATNYVKDLVNEPADKATPSYLASEAKKLSKNKVKTKVFGKNEMKKLGMNAILAVAKGSSQEPKFIIMDYKGGKKKTVALVGKGITFDSGGLGIKPDSYMKTMKSDMAGAAAVIGFMGILSRLKVPFHVIGVVPTCENMLGSSAMKPGDILTAYNKKNIEMRHTDAEGRLVLADAVSYTEKKLKPDYIVDIATLTGASIAALGYIAAALVGNDEKLISQLKKASENSGERLWELPFWDYYKEQVKSDIADVKNISKYEDGEAGVITGGAFIENFVEKTPWAHIDIGGASWHPRGSGYISKDATGYGVRLFASFLKNLK